jgi:hypothetical protein
MNKFVLSLLPDGAAILTTEDELSQREAREISLAWRQWHDNGGVVIIGECRVQHIDSIELELRDGHLVSVP